MPRFIRLVLDEMICCLGGRPATNLNPIYDFRGSTVEMEAITLASFPVDKEARLLTYVFIMQGINATIASGRVQDASCLLDPIEHGIHPSYDDCQTLKRFCCKRFDTDSSIGPSSDLSRGLLGWWGCNYGFTPADVEHILSNPPALMVEKADDLNSFIFAATKNLFGPVLQEPFRTIFKFGPAMIRDEKLIQLHNKWEKQGFVGLALMNQMTVIANSVVDSSSNVRRPPRVTSPMLIPIEFDDCIMVNVVDVENSEEVDNVVPDLTPVDDNTEESNHNDGGDAIQPSRNGDGNDDDGNNEDDDQLPSSENSEDAGGSEDGESNGSENGSDNGDDDDSDEEMIDVDHIASVETTTEKINLNDCTASEGFWPMWVLGMLSVPFIHNFTQRHRMHGCNQQSPLLHKATDMAREIFKSPTDTTKQMYAVPVLIMFATLSHSTSDDDSENSLFGSEWGIEGRKSSCSLHLLEASGPEILYFFYCMVGEYEKGNAYLEKAIQDGKDGEPWSQTFHDACYELTKDFQKDLLDVERMIKKDKDSEING